MSCCPLRLTEPRATKWRVEEDKQIDNLGETLSKVSRIHQVRCGIACEVGLALVAPRALSRRQFHFGLRVGPGIRDTVGTG